MQVSLKILNIMSLQQKKKDENFHNLHMQTFMKHLLYAM